MFSPFAFLVRLYLPISAAIVLGVLISFFLGLTVFRRRFKYPLNREIPAYLGKFLFMAGVPLSIINFLHQADLSGSVLLAPVVAWVAILMAFLCSRLWIRPNQAHWARASQGSFSLASMFGNTGYIGFPVILLLPQLGPDYFGWALFYDVLGTLLGAYILGVILAAHFGSQRRSGKQSSLPLQSGERPPFRNRATLQEVLKNPTMLAFVLGLALRPIPWLDFLYQVGMNTHTI